MLKKLIAVAVAAVFHDHAPAKRTRAKVRDVAFPFRMGAGFPGDVNRTHPASISPNLICAATPPTAYGQAVIVDATTQGVRPLAAADTAITNVWGVTVRPYPIQASSGTAYGGAAIGAATPPTTGIIDVLDSGYIMVKVPAGQAPIKGGAVFVWCAAASGAHVQGGFETIASGGNTCALDVNEYQFNGAPDANGNVEIRVKA